MPRSYAVSAKVLAANRLNLVKANAVPRARRYRLTPARLEACRRNLLKAQAARQAGGGDKFRRGIFCCSLARSLRQAGERLADFEAHFDRVRRAFGRPSGTEATVVEGLGQALWRRLRALRGEGRWEARRLAAWIRKIEHAPHSRTAAHWLDDLAAIFITRGEMTAAVTQVNRRIQQLCELLLWNRWEIRPDGELKPQLYEQRPEAAGNPLCTPQRVAQVLAEKPVEVRSCEEWRERKREAEPPAVAAARAAVEKVSLPWAVPRQAAAAHPDPLDSGELTVEMSGRLRGALRRILPNAETETRERLAQAVEERLRVFELLAEREANRLRLALERAAAAPQSRREGVRLLQELACPQPSPDDPAGHGEADIGEAAARCLPPSQSLTLELHRPEVDVIGRMLASGAVAPWLPRWQQLNPDQL